MEPSSQPGRQDPRRRPDVVALSGAPVGGSTAAIPPRFARQLRGAAQKRRGSESPWVAVARVSGVAAIRREHGDPAAEEFLRGTSSALRTSLRESDKLAPVGREEYGIILDAPTGDDVIAGLQRMVERVGELARRDHRWSGGALSIGVARMSADEPAAILDRAREALARAEKVGPGQVTMAGMSTG